MFRISQTKLFTVIAVLCVTFLASAQEMAEVCSSPSCTDDDPAIEISLLQTQLSVQGTIELNETLKAEERIRYYSTVAHLRDTPGSSEKRVMGKLLYRRQECKSQSMYLGVFKTADECATAADKVEEVVCAYFMFSNSETSWGCRCCASENARGGQAHDKWNIYLTVPWDRINASTSGIENLTKPFATGGLGHAMSTNRTLTRDLFHLHAQLLGFVNSDSATDKDRKDVFEWYQSYVECYPQYFKMQQFTEPIVDWLAGQAWVIMLETGPETSAHRRKVSEAITATGGYKRILDKHGVLVIDNKRLDTVGVSFIDDLFNNVNPASWSSEYITVNDLLSNTTGLNVAIRAIRQSSQNIFDYEATQGAENAFPSDCHVCSKPSSNPSSPTFCQVVVHETVGHNSLDQPMAGLWTEALFERKFTIIQRGAGPDIFFTADSRMDIAKTEEAFKSKNLMHSGQSLEDALKEYYQARDENKNVLRSQIGYDYFLLRPQEWYASYTNQFYTDSALTLAFAVERASAGYLSCLDQFILGADFLSGGGTNLRFYRIEHPYTFPGVRTSQVHLLRNANKHIIGVYNKTNGAALYCWTVDYEGYVKSVLSECPRRTMPPQIFHDPN